jgi:ABC-2 type transport system permease protein
VLSKAAIPLVVLPSMSLILSLITQFILLILGTLILAGSGMSPAPLWIHFGLFESPVVMVYGLTAHVLWFAPIYCWLLLVSAWARRAALLWAVLPVLAIAALERMVSGTKHFITAVGYRFTGAMTEAFVSHDPQTGVSRLSQLDPWRFLTSAGLWLGLIFAAICLAAAVRLRRNREPI